MFRVRFIGTICKLFFLGVYADIRYEELLFLLRTSDMLTAWACSILLGPITTSSSAPSRALRYLRRKASLRISLRRQEILFLLWKVGHFSFLFLEIKVLMNLQNGRSPNRNGSVQRVNHGMIPVTGRRKSCLDSRSRYTLECLYFVCTYSVLNKLCTILRLI